MTLNRAWIDDLVKKYDESYKEENPLENKIFESIKEGGSPPSYLTKDVLMMIAEWKAARIKGYIEKNDDQFVRDVSQVSLSTKNERLRFEVLRLLNGVDIAMASAILFFCFPERYTVMDWRAWKSLKILGEIHGDIEDNYTFEGWQKYNEVCREIARRFDVSLRELDKALWMYKGESATTF